MTRYEKMKLRYESLKEALNRLELNHPMRLYWDNVLLSLKHNLDNMTVEQAEKFF